MVLENRKKILVFSDWFVPGYKAGGPIRSLFHITQNVDHDFYVVTRNTDYHSPIPYKEVTTSAWNTLSENCKVFYIPESEFTNESIESFVKELCPNWIYLNSLFSPSFTIKPLWVLRKLGMLSQTIVAPRGMLTSGALSIKSKKKRVFIFLAKYLGYYKGVKWHATNPDEIIEIKSRFGGSANVHLAPVLSASAPEKLVERRKEVNLLRLVTLARVSPEKGIKEAIEWVCKIPNVCSVSLDIFGAIPESEYSKKCKELAENSDGRVRIMGEINPNLISQVLGEYHFFLLPTKGENFGHAIAEALVNGVPVIISDRTPWKGISARNAGWELPLDKDEFIQAIKQACLMDQLEFNNMVQGAQSLGNELTNSLESIGANRALFE